MRLFFILLSFLFPLSPTFAQSPVKISLNNHHPSVQIVTAPDNLENLPELSHQYGRPPVALNPPSLSSFKNLGWGHGPNDDFDGNGHSDFLIYDPDTRQYRLGLLATQLIDPSGQLDDLNWNLAATGNFAPNGFTDLIFRHALSGKNLLWSWRGGGSTPQPIPTQRDIWWTIEGTGDYNDDGYDDLFWRHQKHGYTDIWFNEGHQWTASGNTQAQSLDWRFVQADDLNGDGFDDIVWCHRQSGNVTVWLMVEDQIHRTWQIPAIGSLAPILDAVVDLNHDGNFDLVWYSRRFNGYFASLLTQDRVTATGWLQPLRSGAGMELEHYGDYDGDGRSDLLFRHRATGAVEAWRMNGFHAFERRSLGSVPVMQTIPGSAYHRNEQTNVSLVQAAEIMRRYLNLIEDPAIRPLPVLHYLPTLLHEGTPIRFPMESSFDRTLTGDAFVFVLDPTPYAQQTRDGMDGAFFEVYEVDPHSGQVTAVGEGPRMPYVDGYSILSEGLFQPDDLIAFPNDLSLSEPEIQVQFFKSTHALNKRVRQPIRKTWVFSLVDATEALFLADFHQVTDAMEHYLAKLKQVPATVFRNRSRDSFTDTLNQTRPFIHCCDHVVVYTTTHGNVPTNGIHSLSIPDKLSNKPNQVPLNADYFVNLLKGIKARTITLVINACYADGLAQAIETKVKANSGKGQPFEHVTQLVILASQEADKVGFGSNDDSDFSGKLSEYLKQAKLDFRNFTYQGKVVANSGVIQQKSVTRTVIDRADDVDCECQKEIDSYQPIGPDGCQTRLQFNNETTFLPFPNGRDFGVLFYVYGDPVAANKRYERFHLKHGAKKSISANIPIRNVTMHGFASVRRRDENDFEFQTSFFRYHQKRFFSLAGLLDVPCGVHKTVTLKQNEEGYVYVEIQQSPLTY